MVADIKFSSTVIGSEIEVYWVWNIVSNSVKQINISLIHKIYLIEFADVYFTACVIQIYLVGFLSVFEKFFVSSQADYQDYIEHECKKY